MEGRETHEPPKKRRPSRRSLTAGALLLAAALAGGGVGAATSIAVGNGGTTTTVVREARGADEATPASASSADALSVSEIYRRASASVVEITVTGGAGSAPVPFGGERPQPQAQGSGFVYDDEGHIVTNAHVVDGADSVEVTFSDGSSYEARVVGTDPSTDLAVLDVEAPARQLEPLPLGDSDALRVGDGVVAIGSPYGLEATVTSGIVSALHRRIDAPNGYSIAGAIQTDAAINRGNSGGPLLNADAEVVGVNAQIESAAGGNDGVGFAIPSNTVRSVVGQILSTGRVEHAYLGVSLAERDGASGAEIADVRSGSPAERAGLEAGDVITRVDGRAVETTEDVHRAIESKKPGDELELTVDRDGATRTVTATLGSRPA
ncbi:MAG TPA: trypsin-like peptidase domain-containing protein [Gaiellaceae bacterium]|nr:trypsin-like peptidase domain-containing protein [Gaiellaceae bacterium]